MLTFIALNLYHWTDFEAQLNINIVNNHKSNNIARYTTKRRHDKEAMIDRVLLFLSFFLNEEIDVPKHTLSGRSFQILEPLKAKFWPKCLTDKCLTDKCLTDKLTAHNKWGGLVAF